MRLDLVAVFIFVIVSVPNEAKKRWNPVNRQGYPTVLGLFKLAFDKPEKHRTFNRVTPVKIYRAAIKPGSRHLVGATFKVNFEVSGENPGCPKFVAAIYYDDQNRNAKPYLKNWSCYFENPRDYRNMIEMLDIMVPDA